MDSFRSCGRRIARLLPRIRRWALPITSVLFLLTGCAFPGAVRPTLKIGLVAPFEGRYRYVGYDVIYAIQLALLEVNEEGGVAGWGVELLAYDDGADPPMAVEQAGKLGVDPAVVGAIGHFRQETTAAAAESYAEASVPLLAPGLLSPHGGQPGEAVYWPGPTAEVVAQALFERISRLAPAGDVVLVGPGGSLDDALQRAARERAGQAYMSVSVDSEEWRDEFLASDPAVVVCTLDPVPAGQVVAALHRAGWGGHVLGGPALSAADFASVAGDSASGAAFVTPWPFPADIPGAANFTAAYRQVSGGTEPGPLALPAYEATWLLLEALERAAADDQPTRQGVSAALSAAERRGVLGKLVLGDAGQWADLGIYWYHIGPDGAPTLLPEQ